MFFSVAGRLGGLPTPPQPKKVLFFARVSGFFLSKAALEGLAGPPRALGALGDPKGALGSPWGVPHSSYMSFLGLTPDRPLCGAISVPMQWAHQTGVVDVNRM